MNQALIEYFRTTEGSFDFELPGKPSDSMGYVRFGPDTICYGRSCAGSPAVEVGPELYDATPDVRLDGTQCYIPFDPTEVVDNLRRERYVENNHPKKQTTPCGWPVRQAYYLVRPLLPVSVRKYLQRFSLKRWNYNSFPCWPVDRTVDRIIERLLFLALKAQGVEKIPFIWFWPHGKSSCVLMTHDVDTPAGLQFCSSLMDLDDSYGIKSSFQVIPAGRYTVPPRLLEEIRKRGFEINVHDWDHDGRLFSDEDVFRTRAAKINSVGTRYGAEGFRAAVLYRNTNWYDAFTFAYDMSIPNVGHLDPQKGGCCTVMPYFIGRILEIPVTTTQDYSLFYILNDYSIDLWKRQPNLISQGNGLVSFIVHPDYILERRARETYTELLDYLSGVRVERDLWVVRPQEVNRWWRERSQMRLVRKGDEWDIAGPARERACIAYATIEDDRLVYTVGDAGSGLRQSCSISRESAGTKVA